jgi:hypothetical protein
MPQIILDGTGKPKTDLVEGAYEICGLNGFEYERTPEEMLTGLRQLNDMMAEWLADGLDLGFDFPTYGNGLLEEPSGIPDSAVGVIKMKLAQRLCPPLGATLSEDAKAALALSWQRLLSRTATIPTMEVPFTSLRGAGFKGRLRWIGDVTPGPDDDDPGDLAAVIAS